MYRERLVPIFAILILVIGFFSSLYVYAFDDNDKILGEKIAVNDVSFNVISLFENGESRNFEELNESGVALDYIIIVSGVTCPSCNSYRIIGVDGYSQTVTWENMQNGLLTLDKRVIFPDLPKAFNIRDVVKIEVV